MIIYLLIVYVELERLATIILLLHVCIPGIVQQQQQIIIKPIKSSNTIYKLL